MIAETIFREATTKDIRQIRVVRNSVEQDVFSNQITYDSPWQLERPKN
jgi:hypothetical protein